MSNYVIKLMVYYINEYKKNKNKKFSFNMLE